MIREGGVRGLIAAGKMRMSEAAMTLADVDKDAENFWRKNRTTLKQMKPGELFGGALFSAVKQCKA